MYDVLNIKECKMKRYLYNRKDATKERSSENATILHWEIDGPKILFRVSVSERELEGIPNLFGIIFEIHNLQIYEIECVLFSLSQMP